jgi:DNA-binding transcriptional LysR family regulator
LQELQEINMELNRMKHLVALADARNFGRAAQQCHLSQSAFSRSVQAAEEELDLQLFDRGTLEVTCTDAGAFVIERARKLLFESRCLDRDVGLYRARKMGDIAFGVGPFPAATMVPALMIELRSSYPGINSRVEVNNWKYLVEHLRAEELDFFVADIRDVPVDADLDINSIGRLHGRFFARAGHPLHGRQNLKPSDMVSYGLASVRLPVQIQGAIRKLLGVGASDRLPVALECDDVNLLKQVVLSSDTVLASTDAAVEAEVSAGGLVALNLLGMPPLHTEMGIVSLKGRSFSPMAEFAVNFLRDLAGKQAR